MVNSNAVWLVLKTFSCLETFVNIISTLYDDMNVQVNFD